MKQFSTEVALYLLFTFGIILRELFTLITLLYLGVMVLYHMFPSGWLKAVWRQLKEGRTAYNEVFGKSFDKVYYAVQAK
jgi:hypothetical protein